MKLEGVRVVDVTVFLPGPHLTMMMADHGAEVIKVEAPGEGDPARHIGFRQGGWTTYFRNANRGKKSIVLDLKTPEGRENMLSLLEEADVFIEAFRPGVMQRLGLDYETVARRAPHIVYCSISAFGQNGPLSSMPAHDLAVQARSGTLSLNIGQDGKPAMPSLPISDLSASLMALSGILMALLRAKDTGQGDYLDISMQDTLVAWTAQIVGSVFAENRPPVVRDERTLGGNAMYGLYETADGKWLALGAAELKFAKTLLSDLGRADLVELCKLPPGKGQDPVRDFLRQTFLLRTLDEWLRWLEGREISYAPMLDLAEAMADPQIVARKMLIRDGEGNSHLGIPIRFSREPGKMRFALPGHGEHGPEILRRLGEKAPSKKRT